MKLGVALIGVAVFACGGKSEPGQDTTGTQSTAVATVPEAASDSIAAPAGSPCRHTGLWETCTLERRLKQSGFVVRRLEENPGKRAGFSVEPIAYSLGSSRIEAFIYEDEKSLARDMALIDTVAVAPKGSPSPWESTPILIRSANLAVVLLTQNQRQAERVVLAITAGAPQPGSPR